MGASSCVHRPPEIAIVGASAGLPSPSGARLSGDDYQHAYTWLHALQLLRPEKGVTRVEFEVRDAGNVDDLVLYRRGQPTLFHQIKFVVDQRKPLAADWFTTAPRGRSASPLQRFHSSLEQLRGDQAPPEMALVTNRQITVNDPILRHIGGRDDKLTPRLAREGTGTPSGIARRAWADHLEITEKRLLEMLDHVAIKAGRDSLEDLRGHCCDAMVAAGLRGLPEDVAIGVGALRDLIGQGCRSLDADAFRDLVTRCGLHAADRGATFVVQGIARSHFAEHAAAGVDWVDLFKGDTPQQRRQLTDPSEWNERLKPELAAAVDVLRKTDFTNVRIDGAFRLSTGFAIGEALPRTGGITVSFRGYGSVLQPAPVEVVSVTTNVDAGTDIAVGISVTDNIEEDVLAFIQAVGLPVSRFVNLLPAAGVGQNSIPNLPAGLGFVHSAFSEIRRASRGCTGDLHLFLCAPNAIGILLGQLWNRMPDTQVYEDANSSKASEAYFPTFRFARL